jgi:hypothetical protein
MAEKKNTASWTKVANLLINNPHAEMPKEYGKFFLAQAKAIDQRDNKKKKVQKIPEIENKIKKEKKRRIKAPKAPPTDTISSGMTRPEIFYEFKGNPKFSNPSDIAKIQEQFIEYATDPKRKNVTWVTRSTGMGKNKDQLWSNPTKSVYPQAALGGKFGETHKVDLNIPSHRKKVEVYVPDVKASQDAYHEKMASKRPLKSNPKLMKPRSDLGSIIINAANTYNTNLKRKLTRESIPFKNAKGGQKWRNEQYQQQKIKTRSFVVSGSAIKYFKDQGMSANDAWIAATEARENAIKSLGKRKVVTVTSSAEFEGKHERAARNLYEGLQQRRKEAGYKSVNASDKITDEFIDEVNTKVKGVNKYSWDFKAGALQFLENKQIDWAKSFESGSEPTTLMSDQRLEDTRDWGGKSTLTNYWAENIKQEASGISGDHSFEPDNFANPYPDDYKGPVPITTSGEELGDVSKGRWRQGTETKTIITKSLGGTWGWESATNASVWKEYPGRMISAEQINTGKRITDYNLNPLKISTSPVSSSFSQVVEIGGGTRVEGVAPMIHGEFDDDIATQATETPDTDNVKTSKMSGFNTSVSNADLEEQLLMSEDMVSIEEKAKREGWGVTESKQGEGMLERKRNTNLVESGVHKGLTKESSLKRGNTVITNAFAGLEGSTIDDIAPVSEIRGIVQAGSGNVVGPKVQAVTVPGDVEEVYSGTRVIDKVAKPTRSQVTRMQIQEQIPFESGYEKTLSPEAKARKEAYPPKRNLRVKEHNERKKKGEQQKFIKDLKAKNNALLKAPTIVNAGVQSNPAAALLNPGPNKPTPTNQGASTVKRDKLIVGDIWEQEGYKVVSTNLGGVHGRGLAKQAADMGLITPGHKSFVTSPVIEAKGDPKFNSGVITLAVKGAAPETAKIPGKAFSESTTAGNVKLMQSEVDKLINFARKNPTERINLPFIGLGFGEGDPNVIKPILARAAQEPNIYLVSKDDATVSKYKESFKPGIRADGTKRIDPGKETIEVKQSRVATKESGTPTFTTKGQKTKIAVKEGANKAASILNVAKKGTTKALLPAVGIGSLLVAPAIAEAGIRTWEKATGKKVTGGQRLTQYAREFTGNTKVVSGLDEKPGYFNLLFGDYDREKLLNWSKRRKSGLSGKGNASIINLLKPSTENAWKNRKRTRRN